jgi:hypothetical protein
MLGASPSPRPGGGAVPPAETIPAREPSFDKKALPLQRAVVAHSNPKAETMSAEQLKERLHLRIEQADERLLRVLDQFAETLFVEYYGSEEDIMELPAPPWAKLLTEEESVADLQEALAEYERGEYTSLDDIDKEAEAW